ncbi:MAG TPA: ATP-grasp domain-containing protein [Abditibacterium sp.]|jgi:hypothetical protein
MIFFPADSLERSQVERDYAHEQRAAVAAGFETAIFDFDALTRGESIEVVLRRVRPREGVTEAIYRGWMLTPENYSRLYFGLKNRGFSLVNMPENYEFCHSMPRNYELLKPLTPRTAWIERERFETPDGVDSAPILAALEGFGDRAIIVKDYVKSQKHKWFEACFIPNCADKSAVERVTRRFLELQGEFLSGGLVFREFVPLRAVGTHPQSGMPLTAEWRLFFFNGALMLSAPYWSQGDYEGIEPDLTAFSALATAIPSQFFALDVAQTECGEWIVIELGDGQVSGLPKAELAGEFYDALARFQATLKNPADADWRGAILPEIR